MTPLERANALLERLGSKKVMQPGDPVDEFLVEVAESAVDKIEAKMKELGDAQGEKE